MTRNEHNLRICLQAAYWVFVYHLCGEFRAYYLFAWMSSNSGFYMFVCLISVLVSLYNLRLGLAMTLGHIVGLLVGHFLGQYFLTISIAKITTDMPATLRHYYLIDRGFIIWLTCILLSMVIASIKITRKTNLWTPTTNQGAQQ